MNKNNKLAFGLVVFFVYSLQTIQPAYAYVDPGSGSVIVTTILGLIAAVGYTVRKYFYKVRNIFSKDKSSDEDNSGGTS